MLVLAAKAGSSLDNSVMGSSWVVIRTCEKLLSKFNEVLSEGKINGAFEWAFLWNAHTL